MATLGRNAMKKTLERLKIDAYTNAKQCNDFVKNLIRRLLTKEKGKMDEETRGLFGVLLSFTVDALSSLVMYVRALEDYGYELDKEWDKLLKSVEETQQSKPIQKKEEAKKTSYVK